MNRFLYTFILIATSLIATAQTGVIAGQITDDVSGETLIGVNVLVEGTSIGAATDLDGNFQIRGLEPGTYTLQVSYISYTPTTIQDVEVKAGETTPLNFSLSSAVFEFEEEVVIKARQLDNTANSLLSMQKQADGVQDGISAQEMSKLGASDAAASLTKVAGISAVDGKYIVVRGLGDRYSTAQLNGQGLASADPYRNSSQMDMIPANLLDNIITSKTFSPELPGNFTGGNVNIKTKRFPEAFTLNIGGNIGVNTQSSLRDDFFTMDGGKLDWLGFDDGGRALPEILGDTAVTNLLSPGFYLKARSDEELASLLNEASQSLNPQMAPSTKSSPVNHGLNFSMGNQKNFLGKPLGFLIGVNYSRSYSFYNSATQSGYQLSDGSASSLNRNFTFNDTRGVENPTLGGMLNLAYKLAERQEISASLLYNHDAQILSRYQYGSYPGALSNNDAIFETRTLHFKERSLMTAQLGGRHGFGLNMFEWSGSYTQSGQVEPDLRFFANSNVGDTAFDINQAEYDLPYHFFRDLEDKQIQGKVDIAIPFAQDFSKSNKVKLGGQFSNKDRSFEERRYQFFRRDGIAYNGDPTDYFSSDNTGIVGFDEDKELYIFGNYITDDTRNANNYSGSEDVYAAYAMTTYAPGKFKISGGIRMETTQLSAASLDTSLPVGAIDQMDFLPALNLTYAVSNNMNIRLSGSQTLARPNMREIAPFVSFDQIGGDIIRGNPDLQRTLIQNFDLRWEWFTRPGELIAVSGYYKHFDNPIIQVYVPQAANPERTWDNVAEGNVAGVELEVRKRLDFIGEKFNNFTVGGNFSYIYSRVDVDPVEYAQNVAINPEFKDYRPFNGQSPYLVNTNLFYSNDSLGMEVGLIYNVFGDRLATVSLNGTPDIYEKARHSLDFRLRKRVSDRLRITLDARNLLDARYQRFMTYRNTEYVVQDFQLGRTFRFGINYSIN